MSFVQTATAFTDCCFCTFSFMFGQGAPRKCSCEACMRVCQFDSLTCLLREIFVYLTETWGVRGVWLRHKAYASLSFPLPANARTFYGLVRVYKPCEKPQSLVAFTHAPRGACKRLFVRYHSLIRFTLKLLLLFQQTAYQAGRRSVNLIAPRRQAEFSNWDRYAHYNYN